MSDDTQSALFALPEPAPAPAAKGGEVYRVLARKYRPLSFADLKGQEALVRTLTNAFAAGRIAHAFILTGVRGVGKTTTARIIAKGLNCVEGPTITPCGKCDACISITEGRCVDVIEQDAASNRGIDDIRFMTEGCKYAPTATRYKVFILDEFHMLTTPAFNALLKILEEPPPHVKFILATTDIHEVPVTILSRCQRFDLRRIEPEVLMELYGAVAKAEGISIDDEALRFLARAADGSARDGLSLLDRAMALGGGTITGQQMRDMLGLADRGIVLELLTATITGKPSEALEIAGRLHRDGADALIVLQDMLDSVHQISRAKVLPAGKLDISLTEATRERLLALAAQLPTPVLARAWQVLLKGVAEVQAAAQPMAALEMLIIRLAHIGSLPVPGDLVKRLEEAPPGSMRGLSGAGSSGGGTSMRRAVVGATEGITEAIAHPAAQPLAQLHSWREVAALVSEAREMQLYAQLYGMVECLTFAPGRVEIFPRPGAQPNLAPRLAQFLSARTGQRWMVSLATAPGRSTLAEEDEVQANDVLRQAAEHPLVKAVLLAFPGARLDAVRDRAAELAEAAPSEEEATLVAPDDFDEF